jgi:hypothetical protein
MFSDSRLCVYLEISPEVFKYMCSSSYGDEFPLLNSIHLTYIHRPNVSYSYFDFAFLLNHSRVSYLGFIGRTFVGRISALVGVGSDVAFQRRPW